MEPLQYEVIPVGCPLNCGELVTHDQMKRIRHSIFTKSVRYPFWGWKSGTQREKDRQRLRQQAEDFTNEIGVDNVVSLIEHEPLFGQFSVVVWWLEELPKQEDLVVRADSDHSA